MFIVRILLLKLHVSSLLITQFVALASLLGFCFLLRFEQVNDEKRARIADLNCKIAEEEEKRQKQL